MGTGSDRNLALQRPWVRTEGDEAWVWNDCLDPVIRLSKAGRVALEEGLLGYDLQAPLLGNYVNPIRPGGFQAYIRRILLRAVDRRKKQTISSEAQSERERLLAFIRQRYHRGHLGIVKNREGRLCAVNEAIQDELLTEFYTFSARQAFVSELSAKMVEAGAVEESARRQVRRWLGETGSAQATHDRFLAWKERRRRP